MLALHGWFTCSIGKNLMSVNINPISGTNQPKIWTKFPIIRHTSLILEWFMEHSWCITIGAMSIYRIASPSSRTIIYGSLPASSLLESFINPITSSVTCDLLRQNGHILMRMVKCIHFRVLTRKISQRGGGIPPPWYRYAEPHLDTPSSWLHV